MNTQLRVKRFGRWKFVVAFLLLQLVILTILDSRPQITAYVEPGLEQEGLHTTILTSVSADTAVELVERAGGVTTSRLHLINSAGATLTHDQIQWLSQHPQVLSIVANKTVSTADSAHDSTDEDEQPPDERPHHTGSSRRRTLALHQLGSRLNVPALMLPDGGVFIISEDGGAIILNADGSQRASQSLSGGSFKTPALVDSDSHIYVASENKRVHMLDATGSVVWQFEDTDKIKGGLALQESGNGERIVYVLNEHRILTALEAASGEVRWRYEYMGQGAGKTKTPPFVAPDGTVYFLTEKGHLVALADSHQGAVVKWLFEADGHDYQYPLLSAADGSIILMNKKKSVTVLWADGTVRYTFAPQDNITATPIVGPDGSLYIVAGKYLYALNPDGSLNFTFVSPHNGKFESSPALAIDGRSVYLALKERRLFALDTQTGALLWQYHTKEDLLVSPVVEANGHIHLATKQGRYVVLSPEGQIVFTAFRAGGVKVPFLLTQDEQTALILTDAQTVEAVSLLPDTWESGAYVLATDDPTAWEFSTLASIDVGADVLHDDLLQADQITGKGVTIAILDSGVAFDSTLQQLDGSHIKNIFPGQADFVGDGLCVDDNGEYDQFDTYCLMSYKVSQDPFGHGTHIAGIIWNNFRDADTDVMVGVAPDADILSVRVLNADGVGTYEDIIEGLQFVVENQDEFDIRVLNLSLSALATTPYFADPLNRAVEAAWASGLTVVAAAGNSGQSAQSITVPGNDPYIITVGAINTNNTPGYWGDDTRPDWSSTGPTHDGFIKPDVLAPGANVISFVDGDDADGITSNLVQSYPHLAETSHFFRMSGTSTASAVTAGVVALMLEANPQLTPDQVKHRLMATAKTAVDEATLEPRYSILQQGLGRIWAPDAVLTTLPVAAANQELDLMTEMAHPWLAGDPTTLQENPELALHFQGPVQKMLSDDGLVIMYYLPDVQTGKPVILGMAQAQDGSWLDPSTYTAPLTFENGQWWHDGYAWSGGTYAWSGGTYAWSGGTYAWSGGTYAWSGGTYAWSGGTYAWSGANWLSDEFQPAMVTPSLIDSE